MPAYTSHSSRRERGTLHPKVQRILDAVIAEQDHSILSGKRTTRQQADLYARGRTAPGTIVTNAKPGESSHEWSYEDNEGVGGVAFDLVPYPLAKRESDVREQYALLAGRVLQEGVRQGVKLRWGNDWNMNGLPVSIDPAEKFVDLGHFEAVLDEPR